MKRKLKKNLLPAYRQTVVNKVIICLIYFTVSKLYFNCMKIISVSSEAMKNPGPWVPKVLFGI